MRFTGQDIRWCTAHLTPQLFTTSSPTANQRHTPGSADCTAQIPRQSEAAISHINTSEITHSI